MGDRKRSTTLDQIFRGRKCGTNNAWVKNGGSKNVYRLASRTGKCIIAKCGTEFDI